jgi:hypothetical protein
MKNRPQKTTVVLGQAQAVQEKTLGGLLLNLPMLSENR